MHTEKMTEARAKKNERDPETNKFKLSGAERDALEDDATRHETEVMRHNDAAGRKASGRQMRYRSTDR